MRKWLERVIIIIATGCYIGYIPIASGTFGSVIGLVLYLFLFSLGTVSFLVITIILFSIGIIVANRAEVIFKQKDPCFIVIDEIVGMLVSLSMLPYNIFIVGMAFLLFRIIDIIKPFPHIENISGGLGVMLDDIVAGILTNIIIRIIYYSLF